jgi:hypothetical protein
MILDSVPGYESFLTLARWQLTSFVSVRSEKLSIEWGVASSHENHIDR